MAGTEMNMQTAIAYIEGYGEGEGATPEQQVEAWAYLIKTGAVWSLQGWYGRNATNLIESGVITEEGEIEWGIFEEVNRGKGLERVP